MSETIPTGILLAGSGYQIIIPQRKAATFLGLLLYISCVSLIEID
jgi:hypothetical protein